MNSHKITLELSEKLFDQLTVLADIKEESIEYLAVQIIAAKLPLLFEKESKFKILIEEIKTDSLHDEIGIEKIRYEVEY